MKKRMLMLMVCLGFAATVFAEGMFDYGMYLRLRQEYFQNAFDFDDGSDFFNDDNYFRLKASVWGRWSFSEEVSLFAKLTSEPKLAIDSDGTIAGGRETWDEEIFFDNLYLDIKNIFGTPVDLRLGRQDFLMTHGEGFVIMDGTPIDGSRSFYFNAARATWNINEDNALDIIYTKNPSRDEYLPVFNYRDRDIVGADEEGFILYGNFTATEDISFEPYYIYKFEDNDDADRRLTLNTIGNRAVYDFAPWRLRGELAYQFGQYRDKSERTGMGGYVYLTRFFNDARFSPALDIGYAHLSGESNPGAGNDSGWNPVFSKWPWISELYLCGYAVERGEPAYWTNLQLWRAKLDMKMTENTGLSLAYNYLRANESQAAGAPFFGDGNERGHLAHIVLTQRFTPNIDGHLYFEYFRPGDFYHEDKQDDALFLRWQLQMRF